MGDESTEKSVSATFLAAGGRELDRIFYNAGAFAKSQRSYKGGPHGRSRQVDVDGQGRRLSSQAESRDAGLCVAAAAAAN